MRKPTINQETPATTAPKQVAWEAGDKPVRRLLRDWLASRRHGFTRWVEVLLGFGLFAGLAGCATLSVPPPPASAAAATSAEEFDTARKLYINQCGRCHKFYNPNYYSSNEWNSWMRKMAKKSKLTSEQEEILGRHLTLYRSEK